MIAIITGDIIHSAKKKPIKWLTHLKKVLNAYGSSPKQWEIYRGDSFQLELANPEEAFIAVTHIKAVFRSIKMDVRMSIGFGKKEYVGKKITESNGSAFIHSGRKFDMLKDENVSLAILSGNEAFDREMNLFLKFALTIIDNWSPATATLVTSLIENPGKNQVEIARINKINQSAVSQQKKRAKFELIDDLNNYFADKVKTVFK